MAMSAKHRSKSPALQPTTVPAESVAFFAYLSTQNDASSSHHILAFDTILLNNFSFKKHTPMTMKLCFCYLILSKPYLQSITVRSGSVAFPPYSSIHNLASSSNLYRRQSNDIRNAYYAHTGAFIGPRSKIYFFILTFIINDRHVTNLSYCLTIMSLTEVYRLTESLTYWLRGLKLFFFFFS